MNAISCKMSGWMAVALAGSFLAAQAAMAQPADFIDPAVYATAGSSTEMAIGDFNGDGRADIATAESSPAGISVMLRTADGGYQTPFVAAAGVSANRIKAADFNGDGLADIVFTTGFSAGVLINTGEGRFAAPVGLLSRVAANYVAIADFNRDGKADLAIAGSDGHAVMLGDGLGGFRLGTSIPYTGASFFLLTGDFNNDGNTDLILPAVAQSVFLPGNGNGTFGTSSTTISVPYGTGAIDFNGDGKLDLVMTTATARQDGATQSVQVWIGGGNGTFIGTVGVSPGGSGLGQPVAGDFNGDGNIDVAVRRGSTATILIMFGRFGSFLGGMAETGPTGAGWLYAEDVDGNNSPDLVLRGQADVTVFRNTHGNPPLPSLVAFDPPSVTGGARSQGTVQLGGAAPAGGAIITLSTSNPATAWFVSGPTVTVPAGASRAVFEIATTAVASPSSATISASYNSASQTTQLNVVPPYSLTAFSADVPQQFGGAAVQLTATLTGPAASGAEVSLVSSNPAVAPVPASMTVPAGSTTGTIPVTVAPVAADTPVTITASLGGITQTVSLTVRKALDTLRITGAIDVVKAQELRVDATSTSSTATITVWNAANGAFIGTLSNDGKGKYSGRFTVSPPVQSMTLKSSLGGIVTGAVQQK